MTTVFNLHTYLTESTDPYYNLALEEFFLHSIQPDTILLYIWQNMHTVVVGRNQDARREVNTGALEEDGGLLARRLSGGGAVYHDLGNLNYTFFLPECHFCIPKQMRVITNTVRSYGIDAQVTGRNDAVVSDRKFSGNAYYHSGGKAYHHGTILIDANSVKMARYLSVTDEKLRVHGVKSVRSRVVNLRELNPTITVMKMKADLIHAFEAEYGRQSIPLNASIIDHQRVEEIRQRISTTDYLLGTHFKFNLECKKRFHWGEILIQLRVENLRISEIRIYTDAIDESIAAQLQEALTGCRFLHADVRQALGVLSVSMAYDIFSLLSTLFYDC